MYRARGVTQPRLTGSPPAGGSRRHTIPWTLALLGGALSSCTWMQLGLTMRTQGLLVFWESAHTRPGWLLTSVHWVRGEPEALAPSPAPPLKGKQTSKTVLRGNRSGCKITGFMLNCELCAGMVCKYTSHHSHTLKYPHHILHATAN